jgi:hypothetical protein
MGGLRAYFQCIHDFLGAALCIELDLALIEILWTGWVR